MYTTKKNYICEYIWIGGNGELRSKTKVIPSHNELKSFPVWNFDGSSTGQAPSNGNTEVVLKPVATYKNPLRKMEGMESVLVLCDTYDNDNKPLLTNHRHNASKIFDGVQRESCWFGLEQEYFIRFMNAPFYCENDGVHYCGTTIHYEERQIVEEHLKSCLEAELTISGINAEVATYQWEFQIGPCNGIDAADELIVARYLLERIAEKYGAIIDYSPKIDEFSNGSGCHINFSTSTMRIDGGFDTILLCMEKLEKKHKEHIACYGSDNHMRLTGHHETSSYDTFSWGIGTRNTSVRIPNETNKKKCGYFEDRRPAANIDPYLATSILADTCIN
jgi:glutamine synthetase